MKSRRRLQPAEYLSFEAGGQRSPVGPTKDVAAAASTVCAWLRLLPLRRLLLHAYRGTLTVRPGGAVSRTLYYSPMGRSPVTHEYRPRPSARGEASPHRLPPALAITERSRLQEAQLQPRSSSCVTHEISTYWSAARPTHRGAVGLGTLLAAPIVPTRIGAGLVRPRPWHPVVPPLSRRQSGRSRL